MDQIEIVDRVDEPRPKGRGVYLGGVSTLPKFGSELPGPKGPGFGSLDKNAAIVSMVATKTHKSIFSFYPELEWLKGDVQMTQEGVGKAPHAELERALTSLRCFRLILQGDEAAYYQFIQHQPVNQQLTRQSFEALRWDALLLVRGHPTLTPEQMSDLIETALVLGDMGKSAQARALFEPYGVLAADHDEFYAKAMIVLARHPTLCPSFATLPMLSQKLLVQASDVAHEGHITHLEGGPEMFFQLRRSKILTEAPLAWQLHFFVHRCDIAGALGHVQPEGSLVYTEQAHQSLQAVATASRVMIDPTKTELDAYNAYLATRASWLGFDPTVPADRVLTRLGAMLRLYTPAQGEVLRHAVSQLHGPDWNRIVLQWNFHEINLARQTPTYLPATLVNLANNPALGATADERLTQAITLGLPFLACVLDGRSRQPLCFNPIAGLAKTNPQLLRSAHYQIDPDGAVAIKE